MLTAVEIYKLLPKSNCGRCGTTSCMGFAAKLATGQAKVDDCATMTDNARETLRDSATERKEPPGTVFEQTLAALVPKVKALDFGKIAPLFGAEFIDNETLTIRFLNGTYRVTKEKVLDESGEEPQPWLSILIYNHLCMPDPPPPAGEWITFASVPASHAKDKAWAGHVENVIANHFSGNVDALSAACEKLGGSKTEITGTHDAAYQFQFFPHYPVLLLFYDAAPEEDFPAQCKMLLDKTAPSYLDIESIVVLGEEFAGRMTE